ncbi:hypothetical protein BO71DRAFT_484189 [Aspergillus ellipticus CBS 707.79]|uniref:Acetyltransferase n=1 Tax=Aspergillus ellipticus CBS 707.79 TaxID=1448320 RepID=A0A319E0F3_9EURO|nr:hypothetical protein BO71DRAFT_484189 [Aspergillus ellipticus CBS 707.79]
MPAATNLLGLTPLNHIPAKLFLPYILYFDTPDPQTAVNTLQKGIDKVISQLPWLAGDVKHFDHDEDIRSHPVQSYLPLPTFRPVSEQRPVLRFQANVFPSKIVLAMSFWHSVFDGTGAGVILEAVAECCKTPSDESETPIAQLIANTHPLLRKKVSNFPTQCQTRLDHPELGVPVFDPNTSTAQWDAMESALADAVETARYTFSPEKVSQMKDTCTQVLPKLQQSSASWISSNDIITAVLAICVDRTLHPERANKTESADFLMAVDLRSRVQPPLPETYPGNAIFPVHDSIYLQETAGQTGEDADLLHLTHLALRVRSKLASMDETLAYSAPAAVADCDDWTKIEASPADIIVTSWRGLKMFSLDFGAGLGHIEDFEPGLALVPGGCIFLPSRVERSGSTPPWEVCITLKKGDSQTLAKDPLFSRILA